jgi:sugar phosphate permease
LGTVGRALDCPLDQIRSPSGANTISHTTAQQPLPLEVAKGIYRGWYIAGVSALSIGAVLGTAQFAFSLFILPLEEEFGWSRTQVNGALTCGVVSGLLSPFIGNQLDRVGAKWTMAGSIALVAIAFLLRSVMTELWHFYLFSAIMFAGMPGATMMPTGRLVNAWFPRIRGRMMGIVTAGNNLGSMIAIPIVAALITLVGWRWTFAVMAIGLFAIALLVVLVIRDTADDVKKEQHKRWTPSASDSSKQLHTDEGLLASEALRTSAFWFLAIGMILQQFVRTGAVSQMVPHLQQMGFSLATASGAMMLLAFFAMSSKLLFGLKQFGRIMGLTSTPIIIPVVIGPIMAGVIFDSTGGYELMFAITIVFLLISIGAFMLIKTPQRPTLRG